MPTIDLNLFAELATTEGVGKWLESVLDPDWERTRDYAEAAEAQLDWRMQNGFRTCFGLRLLDDGDLESTDAFRDMQTGERLRDTVADPEPSDPVQVEWADGPEPESEEEPLTGYDARQAGLSAGHGHSEVASRKLWSYDLPSLPGPMPGTPINVDRVDDSGPEPLPSLTLTPEIVEALLIKMIDDNYGTGVLGQLHGQLAAIQLERGWGPWKRD